MAVAAGKGKGGMMEKKEKREVMVVDDDDEDDMFSIGHKVTIEDPEEGEGRGFVPVRSDFAVILRALTLLDHR